MKITCKTILKNYLDQNIGWHKKVHLYAIAEDFSPETVGRDLRTLAEDKEIKVDKYNGKYRKGLKMYASILTEAKKSNLPTIMIIDGIPKAVYN